MQWSPEQDDALIAVRDWLRDSDEQVFRLFGYAGTGKTTLARHFAEDVPGKVMFGAFTGKAAHVPRQKGCAGASTIHSMIYRSREKGRTHLRELQAAAAEATQEMRAEQWTDQEIEASAVMRKLRREIAEETENLERPSFQLNLESDVRDAALVIIDECSMVDTKMGEDLLHYGKKVLVLGDPAQLPPVGGGGFFTSKRPHFMLTEIHRQAAESPIIRMATDVREGRALRYGDYGDGCAVVRQRDVDASCDQILVGRNSTRHRWNAMMREDLGHRADVPVAGDRLVCLRNNHDVGLLNGAIWQVHAVKSATRDTVRMIVEPQDAEGGPLDVEAHACHFRGESTKLSWWDRKRAEEFDFGYALTVHKSQGSQWDEVVLFDESGVFRQDSRKWLYTGITRAAQRIVIGR